VSGFLKSVFTDRGASYPQKMRSSRMTSNWNLSRIAPELETYLSDVREKLGLSFVLELECIGTFDLMGFGACCSLYLGR